MGRVRTGSLGRSLWLLAGLCPVVVGCGAIPDAPLRPAPRPLADSPLLPVELAGMSQADVELRLGPPDFAREDSPARFLRYRLGACVIDLYLYADAGSGEHHVVHYELRDLGHTGVPGPCGGWAAGARGLPTVESH